MYIRKFKDLNVKPNTIKLLEENISKMNRQLTEWEKMQLTKD